MIILQTTVSEPPPPPKKQITSYCTRSLTAYQLLQQLYPSCNAVRVHTVPLCTFIINKALQ